MKTADERVHTMQLQVQEKMEASEAFARSTVLAERSHSSQVQFRRDKAFKKSMSEADNSVSHYRKKAIYAESKIKENTLKNAQMTSLRHHLHKKEIKNQKDKHMLVLSELKTKYQTLSVRHQKKLTAKLRGKAQHLTKVEGKGAEMLDMMMDMADEALVTKKIARDKSKTADIQSQLAQERLVKYHDFREKYRVMADDLANEQKISIEYQNKVNEYECSIFETD